MIKKNVTKREKEAREEILRRSRFHGNYRWIMPSKRAQYLYNKGGKGNQDLVARMRCGRTEGFNRFWLLREKRMCELCRKGYTRVKLCLEDYERWKGVGQALGY